MFSFLYDSLNPEQLSAVTAPGNSVLQIIAGPGTGKTKVLVARVAHLLAVEKMSPDTIIVTTFTKKAANEMMSRLHALIGHQVDIRRLLIGTFHSICFRIIKQYGKLTGLDNYSIANENDSDKIMAQVVRYLTADENDWVTGMLENSPHLRKKEENETNEVDCKKIRKAISSLKSRSISCETFDQDPLLAFFYKKYQARLKENRLLDFDDCLLYCLELVQKHPLKYIRHVLVDEFQDTNEIQLELMYAFSRDRHHVTIVGDPDQSIYSFRDAVSRNFGFMQDHYEAIGTPVRQVILVHNYRSTDHVLAFSESVMRQQRSRSAKKLLSQACASFAPVYSRFPDSSAEARWIAYQITQLVSLPNQPVVHGDIAILVRSAFQTRAIEDALRRARVPSYLVKGVAFWSRKEILAMIDYLRVISNKFDRMALVRILNFPKRGVGDKTMVAIEDGFEKKTAIDMMTTPNALQMLRKIVDSIKLSSKAKESLRGLISFVNSAHEMISDDMDRASFFDWVYTNSGLQAEYKNDPNADLNVKEIKQIFCEYQRQDIDGNLLSSFIQSVGLHEAAPESSGSQVAISTIHGAKGLEWPVVFVPGLTEGILPARFAISSNQEENIDEERRCFYVSTTRAKALLYLSSYEYCPGIGKCNESRYLKGTSEKAPHQTAFSSPSIGKLYKLFGKEVPDWDENFYHRYKLGLAEFEHKEKEPAITMSTFGVSGEPFTPGSAPKYEIVKREKQVMKVSAERKPLGRKRHFTAPRFVNVEKSEKTNKAPPYVPKRKRRNRDQEKKERIGPRDNEYFVE